MATCHVGKNVSAWHRCTASNTKLNQIDKTAVRPDEERKRALALATNQ